MVGMESFEVPACNPVAFAGVIRAVYEPMLERHFGAGIDMEQFVRVAEEHLDRLRKEGSYKGLSTSCDYKEEQHEGEGYLTPFPSLHQKQKPSAGGGRREEIMKQGFYLYTEYMKATKLLLGVASVSRESQRFGAQQGAVGSSKEGDEERRKAEKLKNRRSTTSHQKQMVEELNSGEHITGNNMERHAQQRIKDNMDEDAEAFFLM
ncbi:hypothetical protein EJB05_21256, partial [Eragrostis curvula]